MSNTKQMFSEEVIKQSIVPTPMTTEFHVSELPATLPPHCGETLKVVPDVPTSFTPKEITAAEKRVADGLTSSALPISSSEPEKSSV